MAFYYDLDLFSNFTYFLDDPVRGDQFEQPDQRWVAGLKASHTLFHRIGKAESESTVGLQVRNDAIHNGLFLTQARRRYATVREDDVWETSLGPYAENRTRWNDWLRSSLGVRFDGFRFDVDSNRPENSGTRTDGLDQPQGRHRAGALGGDGGLSQRRPRLSQQRCPRCEHAHRPRHRSADGGRRQSRQAR